MWHGCWEMACRRLQIENRQKYKHNQIYSLASHWVQGTILLEKYCGSMLTVFLILSCDVWYSWFMGYLILGIFDIIDSCDVWYIFLISGIYDFRDLYIYDILDFVDFWYSWFLWCLIYLISGIVDTCHIWYAWWSLDARHNTAREVLWKYANSMPNIVNILWQKYFDSMGPYFDSTWGTEAVS